MKLNTLSRSRDLFQSATWQFVTQARLLFLRLACKNYLPVSSIISEGNPRKITIVMMNRQYVSQVNGRLVQRLQRPSPMSVHMFNQLPDLSCVKISIIRNPLRYCLFQQMGRNKLDNLICCMLTLSGEMMEDELHLNLLDGTPCHMHSTLDSIVGDEIL